VSSSEPSAPPSERHYPRESAEFARVTNLSDGVFAIALTLLVLTLDAPGVPPEALASALVEQIPQLVVFLLAFGLVANIWWVHHKFFRMLGRVEPGLTAINFAILGGVALVPFPTSLVGNAPTARAAVVPFIGLFAVLGVLYLGFLVRMHAVGATRWPLPERVYRWLLADWVAFVGLTLLGLGIALWLPVAGLVMVALNGTLISLLMAWRAPPEYHRWS
jgi:uncharacterized membrane protein